MVPRLSLRLPIVLSALFAFVASLFAAYIAGRALTPGAHHLSVFRFGGAPTLRANLDRLVCALLTAGTFDRLWPK